MWFCFHSVQNKMDIVALLLVERQVGIEVGVFAPLEKERSVPSLIQLKGEIAKL